MALSSFCNMVLPARSVRVVAVNRDAFTRDRINLLFSVYLSVLHFTFSKICRVSLRLSSRGIEIGSWLVWSPGKMSSGGRVR